MGLNRSLFLLGNLEIGDPRLRAIHSALFNSISAGVSAESLPRGLSSHTLVLQDSAMFCG